MTGQQNTHPQFRVVVESPNEVKHFIRPDDINLRLQGTFGKAEVEDSARKIITFFQSRGYWCEFSSDEIARFYRSKGWNPELVFLGLANAWWDDAMENMGWRSPLGTFFAQGPNGTYYVTDAFIERCAKDRKPVSQVA